MGSVLLPSRLPPSVCLGLTASSLAPQYLSVLLFHISSAFFPSLLCLLPGFSALVLGRTFVSSVHICYSFFLSIGWVCRLGFPFRSFLHVLDSPASFYWLGFSFSWFVTFAHSSWLPYGYAFIGVLPLLSLSLLFLGFLLIFGRSSASVESLVPSVTGSSLWAESVAVSLLYATSSSLLFLIPVGRFSAYAS